jgi:hypothetical protein
VGDYVASQEPPGSTHTPLKEQLRAAPFFMHGWGTAEQAQKKAGRVSVLPSDFPEGKSTKESRDERNAGKCQIKAIE